MNGRQVSPVPKKQKSSPFGSRSDVSANPRETKSRLSLSQQFCAARLRQRSAITPRLRDRPRSACNGGKLMRWIDCFPQPAFDFNAENESVEKLRSSHVVFFR